jgi:hypothetical protein
MDFWDHLFDNEYKQRADIESLKRSSLARKRGRMRDRQQVQDLQQRIEELEDQVGELALLCRSLLTVLREDGTVQPERFQEVMHRMDAEDGVVDGKITPEKPASDEPQVAPKIQTWPKNKRMR